MWQISIQKSFHQRKMEKRMKIQNLSWGGFHKKLEELAGVQSGQSYYYFSQTGNVCIQSRNWVQLKRAFCFCSANSDAKVISVALSQFLQSHTRFIDKADVPLLFKLKNKFQKRLPEKSHDLTNLIDDLVQKALQIPDANSMTKEILADISGEDQYLSGFMSESLLQMQGGPEEFLKHFSCIKAASEGNPKSIASMKRQLELFLNSSREKDVLYAEEAIRMFFTLSSPATHKKLLTMLDSPELQDKVLTGLPEGLENLDLSSSKWLGDSDINKIVKYQSLRTLNLSYCTGITNHAVETLVNLNKLEELSLRGCVLLRKRIITSLSKFSHLRELDLLNGPRLHIEDVSALERRAGKTLQVKYDPLYTYLMDPNVTLPGGGFILLYYSMKQGLMA